MPSPILLLAVTLKLNGLPFFTLIALAKSAVISGNPFTIIFSNFFIVLLQPAAIACNETEYIPTCKN